MEMLGDSFACTGGDRATNGEDSEIIITSIQICGLSLAIDCYTLVLLWDLHVLGKHIVSTKNIKSHFVLD
jgi:hypothetical protein